MGATSCPAECQKTVTTGDNNQFSGVRAGDLSIALNSTNGTTSIPNDGVIKVAELNINASQDIQLQSLNVTRLGLSQNQGLKVWIEKDGRRITSSSSFFGDSKANLVFNGGYVVKKGEKLDLVISLDKSKVQAGSELSFKLSDVTSSAMNTTVSPDTTGIYRTTNYSVTSLSFLPMTNADRNYNISKDSYLTIPEPLLPQLSNMHHSILSNLYQNSQRDNFPNNQTSSLVSTGVPRVRTDNLLCMFCFLSLEVY